MNKNRDQDVRRVSQRRIKRVISRCGFVFAAKFHVNKTRLVLLKTNVFASREIKVSRK